MSQGDPDGALRGLVVAAPMGIEARALERGAPDLRVVRTGAGPERARSAAAALRDDPAAAVVVAGVCGSVVPELVPGDVVLARWLTAEGHAKVEPRERDNALMRGLLAQHGFSPHFGPIRGADHVVRDRERFRIACTGALAVDMESIWLAAGSAGRPFVVVRVVVDGPGHELLRPGILRQGRLGLRRLRELAPIIEAWGRSTVEHLGSTGRHRVQFPPPSPSTPSLFGSPPSSSPTVRDDADECTH